MITPRISSFFNADWARDHEPEILADAQSNDIPGAYINYNFSGNLAFCKGCNARNLPSNPDVLEITIDGNGIPDNAQTNSDLGKVASAAPVIGDALVMDTREVAQSVHRMSGAGRPPEQ